MYWNTFARSALFAAVAAAAWLPWVMLASPVVGPWNARALYLVAVAATYVGGLVIASTPRRRRRSPSSASARSAAAA